MATTGRRLRLATAPSNDGWRWRGGARPSTRRQKHGVLAQILVDVLNSRDLATVWTAHIDPPFEVRPPGITFVALTQMATL